MQLHFGTNGVINRFKSPPPPDANLGDRGTFSFSADAVSPFKRGYKVKGRELFCSVRQDEDKRSGEEESEVDAGKNGATAGKDMMQMAANSLAETRSVGNKRLLTKGRDGQLATRRKMVPAASAPR